VVSAGEFSSIPVTRRRYPDNAQKNRDAQFAPKNGQKPKPIGWLAYTSSAPQEGAETIPRGGVFFCAGRRSRGAPLPFAHTGKSCSLIPELPAGRAEVLQQRRCRRQASHSGLQIRGLPVFTSRLRVRSRARESSGPGDWNAMKLPRRTFLHLAAGAAALPVVSHIARAQAYPTRIVMRVFSST
jgi:hypothetical protein